MQKTIRLFHLTTEMFGKQIDKSQCVKMSTGQTNARSGTGSYWTSMDPAEFDKEDFAGNNFDSTKSMQSRLMNIGKFDYGVRVDFPIGDQNLKKIEGDRDIYIYTKEMNLSKFEHKIDKFENFKVSKNGRYLADYFRYLEEYFNNK